MRPLLLLLPLLPACMPTGEGPGLGDTVGEYEVLGTLEQNFCGDGLPLDPQILFRVTLRALHRDAPGRGSWQLPGGPALDGALAREGNFYFEQRGHIVAIQPDPDFGIPGCALQQVEIVEGELRGSQTSADAGADAGIVDAGIVDAGIVDAGVSQGDGGAPADAAVSRAAEDAFGGSTTISLAAAPGSDCTALLPPTGAFASLPCTARYRLEGERLAAAP